MKKAAVFIIILIVVAVASIFLFVKIKPSMINITSPAFKNGGTIPSKYTCDGENINPPILIDGVSESTKSLVLIVDDPDAPVGTFNHWLIWNIDPKTNEIKENSRPPEAITGTNSAGLLKYTGPCPPSGTHRYFFKIYALDTILGLSGAAAKQDVEGAMKNHIIDSGELMAKYSR